MSKKHRIPLPSHLATRDSSVTHDGQLSNFYVEDTPLGKMIVKRPGLTNNIALGPCIAQGSTFFNSNNYFICSNTLYINPQTSTPPTCAAPGSVFTFGAASENLYATFDPITKNIWASNELNTHTLTVYNSTTGAVVQTITIPATSGDTTAIFYVAATRKMMAVSTASAVGIPNFFVINPDTYAIENSIITSTGSGVTWDTLCLDNTTTKLVAYNGNALGGGGNFSIGYLSLTPLINDYPITGIVELDAVYAPDIPVFALLAPGHVTLISDFAGAKTATDFAYNNDTAIPPTAYDTKRKNFWVFERGTHKLFFINVNGSAIGSSTLVTTLPANPLQVTYDASRDVLWATFDDGTYRKISPSDGSILRTFMGSSTGTVNSLAGNRLLLRDSCTLIQCDGGGATGFHVLGIQ